MRFFPKVNTLKKSILLYRGIRYRKGHGVHSPFAFNLITKVIEEKCSYYSFQDIELLRKQLLYSEDPVSYPDRRNPEKMRKSTIGNLVKREAINRKRGELLFKLTNYFQSKRMIQLGPTMGISTLYMTAYASDIRCIAIESVPEFAAVACQVFSKTACNPIDLRIGSYQQLLPRALNELGKVDFIFFNALHEQEYNLELFKNCLPYVHDETLFVFNGIRMNKESRDYWKKICAHPQVTVSVDLYAMGLVFFNRKLHKRNYIVYF